MRPRRSTRTAPVPTRRVRHPGTPGRRAARRARRRRRHGRPGAQLPTHVHAHRRGRSFRGDDRARPRAAGRRRATDPLDPRSRGGRTLLAAVWAHHGPCEPALDAARRSAAAVPRRARTRCVSRGPRHGDDALGRVASADRRCHPTLFAATALFRDAGDGRRVRRARPHRASRGGAHGAGPVRPIRRRLPAAAREYQHAFAGEPRIARRCVRVRVSRGVRALRAEGDPLVGCRLRRMGDPAVSTQVGVALLGLGTVGSAVARVFADRGKRLDAAAGRPLRLIGAAVRDRRKARDVGDLAVTTDPFRLLDDPGIHIVIEVIGGTSPARDLTFAAFERGRHVVTANKELVAKEWNPLHEAAKLAKRELRFEAAVAAAIPLIAATRMLAASRPRIVRGLLNGTTTYICSRMESGLGFDAALEEAIAKGYAEADSTADVDGFDAAYKLSILISLLEGRHFHPDNVRRTTLRGLSADTVRAAASRDTKVRYIATADFGERATKARVGPEEVPVTSPEGVADGPTNVVTIETDLAGRLVFSGPGAGGDATASAILGDVIAIARTMR